jgi:hypothetical protein
MTLQFHVYRLNWRCSSIGAWSHLPGRTRLATYTTAAEADTDLRRREANARGRVNPFGAGNVGQLTSMPAAIFHDLLHDLGLKPATNKYPGWYGWWEKLRDEQRSRLWEAFNKVRFYEVIQRPAVPIGYAVVGLNWIQFAPGTEGLLDEGGIVKAVYRDRTKVERSYYSLLGCSHQRWLPADDDPFDPETQWRAYASPKKQDIVQVDLEGNLRKPSAKKSRKIYLVVRRVWMAGSDAPQPLKKERVPVCGFADHKSAEERCHELETTVPEQHDLCDLFSGWFDDDDTDEFFKIVEPLNLPAPDTNVPKWWFENRDQITPEQRLEMWKLFPERRVYEVMESTLHE